MWIQNHTYLRIRSSCEQSCYFFTTDGFLSWLAPGLAWNSRMSLSSWRCDPRGVTGADCETSLFLSMDIAFHESIVVSGKLCFRLSASSFFNLSSTWKIKKSIEPFSSKNSQPTIQLEKVPPWEWDPASYISSRIRQVASSLPLHVPQDDRWRSWWKLSVLQLGNFPRKFAGIAKRICWRFCLVSSGTWLTCCLVCRPLKLNSNWKLSWIEVQVEVGMEVNASS